MLADLGARLDDDAALSTGLGTPSDVRVTKGLSITGGPVDGDDLGTLLGNMVVSLRINVPRMGVTSDGTGR